MLQIQRLGILRFKSLYYIPVAVVVEHVVMIFLGSALADLAETFRYCS